MNAVIVLFFSLVSNCVIISIIVTEGMFSYQTITETPRNNTTAKSLHYTY